MIVIREIATQEIQFVTSTEGYGAGYQILGELPQGVNPESYKVDESDAIVEDVEWAKAIKWNEVKARRELAEFGGCNTPLGRVDTSPASKLNINGAVVMAQIALAAARPFSMSWTMADNSIVTHDANQMIAMGVAVGQHVEACHAAAQALRNTIDAATTIADVAAIDIEAVN